METIAAVRDRILQLCGEREISINRLATICALPPSSIKNILYEKGIPKELWDAALDELPEMDGAIDKLLHQKLDGRTLDDKLIKKTADALMRRGHCWQDVRDGLRRYREGLDLEEME